MTIVEFLRSLSWELNMYEVSILWKWQNKCPVCRKYYDIDDDEYSHEKSTVADFREDEEHFMGYPDVYNTKIAECEIIFEHEKITITHIEYGDEHVCAECESDGPVNLFAEPMTKEEQYEMSESVDYNVLFAELQKNCNIENCCNAFANITLGELIEMNYLLDRLLIFCENVDTEELEDYECGDKVLELYRLADTLFSRDLS